jgi:hypothetical protein
MVSIFAVLLVVSVLGLALNGLRLYGLIAVVILALQAPVISLVALVLGVAAFIFVRYFK